MKFGLYARVSTADKQDIELQLKALRTYSGARGWEVFDEYKDVGQSGSKERRPELDRLMEDARKRRIDGILVWKLDRFGRSLRSLVTAFEELKDLGVQFVSYTENLDFSTPAGRAMVSLIGVFAEFERDLIRERVKAGLQNARAKGIRLGRASMIDTGFLTKVSYLRDQGLTIRAIARYLGVSSGLVHKALKLSRREALDYQWSKIKDSLST
jgi:DNA invertase Pin-like site-specific DNA recombinase